MASITVPTPVEITQADMGGYLSTNNQEGIQALLGTDWTVSGKTLYCLGIPIMCYYGSYPLIYSHRTKRSLEEGRSGYDSTDRLCYENSYKIYFYDFGTFVIISSNNKITDSLQNSEIRIILIDKTNKEAIDGFTESSTSNYKMGGLSGIIGRMFNYISNGEVYITRYAPTNVGSYGNEYGWLREKSTTEVIYYKIRGYDNKESSRFLFLLKFPVGSSDTVLHVDDKYIYVTHYDIYNESTLGYGVCTLGIDVTAEINAQS